VNFPFILQHCANFCRRLYGDVTVMLARKLFTKQIIIHMFKLLKLYKRQLTETC